MKTIDIPCTDHRGQPYLVAITEWHAHEMVDRLDCLQKMVEDMAVNHIAGCYVDEELTSVMEALAAAYQKMSALRFYAFEEEK